MFFRHGAPALCFDRAIVLQSDGFDSCLFGQRSGGMRKSQRTRFICPPLIAYAERGRRRPAPRAAISAGRRRTARRRHERQRTARRPLNQPANIRFGVGAPTAMRALGEAAAVNPSRGPTADRRGRRNDRRVAVLPARLGCGSTRATSSSCCEDALSPCSRRCRVRSAMILF